MADIAEEDDNPVTAVMRRRAKDKLGFMMRMDSGNWRGKGTEYKTQKANMDFAQGVEDRVRGFKYDDSADR